METVLVRLVAYVAFLSCALALVTTLATTVAPWVGFGAGVVVFGAVAVPLFLREQREHGVKVDRNITAALRGKQPNFQIAGDGDDSP
jgi:hypothetical protein